MDIGLVTLHGYKGQAMWTLVDDLDAFYLEHGRCGDLDSGVEGESVWMTCRYGAELNRLLDERNSEVTTSFDLWSSSRHENSSRARLLLLVMATEALVEQMPRSESELRLLDNFLIVVRDSSLLDDAKRRLRDGLSLLSASRWVPRVDCWWWTDSEKQPAEHLAGAIDFKTSSHMMGRHRMRVRFFKKQTSSNLSRRRCFSIGSLRMHPNGQADEAGRRRSAQNEPGRD